MGTQVGSSSPPQMKILKWIPRGEKLQKIRNQTLKEKQVPDSVGKSRYDSPTEKAPADDSTHGIPGGADRSREPVTYTVIGLFLSYEDHVWNPLDVP